MSEHKLSKENLPEDFESRTYQILGLVSKKPMRWVELKDETKLSNSTLFRIITKLEDDEIILKELKDKKLQWTLTPKGRKRAADDIVCKFMRKAFTLPAYVTINGSDWVPMEKTPSKEEVKSQLSHARNKEDMDYYQLEKDYLLGKVFEAVKGTEYFEHIAKGEEALFSSSICPRTYASYEPKSPAEIDQFCQKISLEISKNFEQLYRWFLPKNNTLHSSDSFTNKFFLVFEVELAAKRGKLKAMLSPEKSKNQSGDNQNGKKN